MMGKRTAQVRAPKAEDIPHQRHLLRRGRCVVPAVKPDFHEAVFVAEQIGAGGSAAFVMALIGVQRPMGRHPLLPSRGKHEVDLPVDGIYLVFEKELFSGS